MQFKFKRSVTAVAVVATAAFAGGAYAATQASQTSPRQALLGDAAKRLNVTPAQLTGALQGAFLDQLQAAVAAGRLTQAQADAIKQHVRSGGGGPGLFGHERFGFRGLRRGSGFSLGPGQAGRGGRLKAAADYLGLTLKQLFDQLGGGKSLAQIAQAGGKSVSGLKSAMLTATRARLDRALSAKLITSAQKQQLLSRLPARLDAQINRAGFRFYGPGSPGKDRDGFRFGPRAFGPGGAWMGRSGGPPIGPGGPPGP